MAQNIDCVLEDEDRKLIQNSNLNFAFLVSVLEKEDAGHQKYPWLHTIDEYGDTVFNHQQIPMVVLELEALKKDVDHDNMNLIDGFINFVKKIEADQYIRFIGD